MKGSSKILWVALLSVAYFAPGVADAAPAVQANDDSATTNEDTVVTVSVLANDTDTHGANRLLVTVNSVVVTSGAPSGTPTATVSGSPPNQTVDVTPGANFNGTLRVDYTIRDFITNENDDASIVVDVTSVNDAPFVAHPVPDIAMVEDGPNVLFRIFSVGADCGGTPCTTPAVIGPAGLPVFGDIDSGDINALTYAITGNTNPSLVTATYATSPRRVKLVVAANQNGFADITLTFTDPGGLSASDTFRVTVSGVDDLPNAVNDAVTMAEDTSGGVTINVLANDDVGDTPSTITQLGHNGQVIVDGVATGPVVPNASEGVPTSVVNPEGQTIVAPNGTIVDNGDGTVTYTPKNNFNGSDHFTYTVRDANGDLSTATVTVTVTPVNDAPALQTGQVRNATIVENTFYSLVAPGVLQSSTDADGDTITAVLQSTPAHGTVVLSADGSLVYTPVVNFIGDDAFTYFISDGTATNVGAPYVVNIHITAAPPPPAPPPLGTVEFNFQLSNLPLEVALGVDPNVLVLMDDSGSMDWSLTTSNAEGRFPITGRTRTQTLSYVLPLATNIFDPVNIFTALGYVAPDQAELDADADMRNGVGVNTYGVWRARNSQYNHIYYNPKIYYTPWRGLNPQAVDYPNANPAAALLDANDPTQSINLLTPITFNTPQVPTLRIGAANTKTVTTHNLFIPHYYTTTVAGEPLFDSPHALVQILNNGTVYAGGPDRADCAVGDNDPATCTYAQEIQNFANWFTYYRSREYTTKNALGRVVADAESLNVGYFAMNNANERIRIAPMNSSFRAGNKRSLLDQVYKISSIGGTPLRSAIDRAGKHFECVAGDAFGSGGASAPGTANCPIAATPAGNCQQNYLLAFTDGSWNGDGGITNIAANNYDNNNAVPASNISNFDEGRYGDNIGGTLADMAMKYYERDLQPTLPNEVPVTPRDLEGATLASFGNAGTTTFQHMATYTIGFGLTGLLTDANIPTNIATPVAWGNPFALEASKIDDLRHAALNGRGLYLSANDPKTLNSTMTAAFQEFSSGTGAASSVTFDAARLSQGSVRFRGFFNSRSNTGEFIAELIDTNGDVVGAPVWSAATRLDAITPTNRVIVSFNPLTRVGIPFRFASLTAPQKVNLTSAMLDYLRGDRTNERPSGLNFRDRPIIAGLLGDIVHSTPLFVGAPGFIQRDRAAYPTTSGSLYSEFKLAQAGRTPMVYTAANDGMLHAFNANNGNEAFAFIPDKILNTDPYSNPLYQLTSATYSHKFFNDLAPEANDAFITPRGVGTRQWRTVLVGGLAGGGKGYYAIDITNPANFVSEASAKDQVLWEFSDADDTYPVDALGVPLGGAVGAKVDLQGRPIKDLGYSYGEAQIQMTNAVNGDGSKKWAAIFGNGYNSTAGIAKLFVLFVEQGVDGWGAGDVIKLDTGQGAPIAPAANAGLPNGLGAARAVDTDNNGTVDLVYAGDILGNLYRFDMRNSNPANWTVTRIFQAKFDNNTPVNLTDDVLQPVVNRPVVVRNPQSTEGFIVVIGTGSYVTTPDGTSTGIQSIYGVWDRLDTAPDAAFLANPRSLMVEQSFTNLVSPTFGTIRTNSNNAVNYVAPSTTRGWFIDLDPTRPANRTDSTPNLDTSGDAAPAPQFPGERAVRNIIIRNGFAFTASVIPRKANTCVQGPGGFLLTFNPATGGIGGLRGRVAFDANNDGKFDSRDEVGGTPVGGFRLEGVPSDIATKGNLIQGQESTGSGINGTPPTFKRTANLGAGDRAGRLSWQELD